MTDFMAYFLMMSCRAAPYEKTKVAREYGANFRGLISANLFGHKLLRSHRFGRFAFEKIVAMGISLLLNPGLR
ncbi:MAG: hypothetical protein JKX91_14010 [Rhizobiaceae bacterium]|nr:hypothetical protein [Rhizobiaceae bacterium]